MHPKIKDPRALAILQQAVAATFIRLERSAQRGEKLEPAERERLEELRGLHSRALAPSQPSTGVSH